MSEESNHSAERSIENKIATERNKYEIEHNKEQIEKNQQFIDGLDTRVRRLRRIVWLTVIMVFAIFLLIFINGMMVHWGTGLNEYQNEVFDGTGPGQVLD